MHTTTRNTPTEVCKYLEYTLQHICQVAMWHLVYTQEYLLILAVIPGTPFTMQGSVKLSQETYSDSEIGDMAVDVLRNMFDLFVKRMGIVVIAG